MNEEDLKFYNMQDKEELVWMCISRDNRIKSLQQRINKSIDYIKEYKERGYSKYDENEIEIELIDKILEILKGDNNEDNN